MSSAAQLAKYVSKRDLVSALDVIDLALQVGTEEQFSVLMRQLLNVLPIDCADVCVAQIGPDQTITRTQRRVSIRYPAAWVGVYRRRGYQKIDPIVRNLFVHERPMYWAELRSRNQALPEQQFYRAAEDFGLKDGISYGARFDNSTAGSFFTLAGPDLGREQWHQKLFEYLAPHLHVALSRTHLGRQTDKPRLTPRELQALTWAKYGKTNSEISVVLAVTPRAVKFHIENAMRKLNAVNRTQAIAVALSLGLIKWC